MPGQGCHLAPGSNPTTRRPSMAKADRVPSTPRTTASEFLIAVNRIRLSQMIRDPYVAAAFKAASRRPAPAIPNPTPPSVDNRSIRALTIFESLPLGHSTLRIADDARRPI